MNKANPLELNRTQLIDALRPKVHPSLYQQVTRWPTPVLAALVTFYQAGGTTEEMREFLYPKKSPAIEIVITSELVREEVPPALNFDIPRQKMVTRLSQ